MIWPKLNFTRLGCKDQRIMSRQWAFLFNQDVTAYLSFNLESQEKAVIMLFFNLIYYCRILPSEFSIFCWMMVDAKLHIKLAILDYSILCLFALSMFLQTLSVVLLTQLELSYRLKTSRIHLITITKSWIQHFVEPCGFKPWLDSSGLLSNSLKNSILIQN